MPRNMYARSSRVKDPDPLISNAWNAVVRDIANSGICIEVNSSWYVFVTDRRNASVGNAPVSRKAIPSSSGDIHGGFPFAKTENDCSRVIYLDIPLWRRSGFREGSDCISKLVNYLADKNIENCDGKKNANTRE